MDNPAFAIRLVLILLACTANTLCAQISHGGRPLPWISTRSSSQELFEEMPTFDVNEELRIDSILQSDLKGGLRFAYKFMADFTPANSGISYLLADGTKIWRLGIRSKNAYSINVLFSEYELPEGARLFLYSPDQSQILGSFNHQNNSELGILPVAPIQGEELIIEYQEPADVDFGGRLKVGEVNHAYRDIRGSEPTNSTSSSYACMPPPLCISDTTTYYDDVIRSVVLLIVNGETLCSGVLINNTRNDGTPYLLTASHCLNKSFTITNPDYAQMAGTIVSFFNYESPFCSTILRGTEELSMASAKRIAVNEKTDLALLQLLEMPPVYYRPYYAGWNISEAHTPQYVNIHHPVGSPKRINFCSKAIKLISFSENGGTDPYNFNPNSFWQVSEWETGSTAGGSSGSPLFDNQNRIIGALTGGKSTCSTPKNDVFYALSKSWTSGEADSTNLQPWLSPDETSRTTCKGLDPYLPYPAQELSNIVSSGYRETATVTYLDAPEDGQQFGVNTLGSTTYAEAFTIEGSATLYGAYLVTPAIQNNTGLQVEVTAYSSFHHAPADSLTSALFAPTYTNKSILTDDFQETNKSLSRAQESFILFDTPIEVSGEFFIGYQITALEKDSFAVYNLPANTVDKNTTWIKVQNQWIENTSHPANPFKTSLYIQPVIQKKESGTAIQSIALNKLDIRVDRASKTITVMLPEGEGKVRYEIISLDGNLIGNGYMDPSRNYFNLNRTGFFLLKLYLSNGISASKFIL